MLGEVLHGYGDDAVQGLTTSTTRPIIRCQERLEKKSRVIDVRACTSHPDPAVPCAPRHTSRRVSLSASFVCDLVGKSAKAERQGLERRQGVAEVQNVFVLCRLVEVGG